MQENKEFEKWYEKEYGSDEDEMSLGHERISREAFQAEQQSERDKNRWIPVTERLPTEKDGVVSKVGEWDFGFGNIDDDYVGDKIISVLTSDGKTSHENIYDFDKKEFTANYNVIKWQPLPEV